MLSALRPILVSTAILFPLTAHGACVQSDLTGSWRFEFNTGDEVTGSTRTRMMSCAVIIKSTGALSVPNCQTISGNADAASVGINAPGRVLRMTARCEVSLGGGPGSPTGNDIDLNMGNATYFVDGFRMTMNRSKDVMIGYALINDHGAASVLAVKRD